MYRRGFNATIVIVFILLASAPGEGIDIDVTSSIPSFILDDWMNLTGTTSPTLDQWDFDTNGDFQSGMTGNATIEAGSVWTKPTLQVQILNNGNPVLSPGSGSDWDLVILTATAVLHVGNAYYMFYIGARGSDLATARHVGMATSTDGISWTKYSGNPVMKSRVNSYDYTNIMSPIVVTEGNTWKMWYAGNRGTQDVNICYATSSDGFNWTKFGSNPVLKNSASNSAWNGIDLRPSSVFKNDTGTYWMYFRAIGTGGIGNLGLATSSDGTNWTYHASNPLYSGDTKGWDKAGNVGTATWEIVMEPPFTVSTGSWLLIVVVVVVIGMESWYLRGRSS